MNISTSTETFFLYLHRLNIRLKAHNVVLRRVSMASIKNYYAGGNTFLGFYSLYEDIFRGLKRLYIIKGGPGTGKSSLMRSIGFETNEKGYDIEFFHCSSDNDSLDGLIIPGLGVGIVDGTAPHIVDPKYPGAVDKIINLGEYWDENNLRQQKSSIIRINNEISDNFKMAYKNLNDAKIIHDEWEEIYLSAMDFTKADSITQNLLSSIFDEALVNESNPSIRKLFFGAATPLGAVNFIENITGDINKRYIVKGRPGSGKSTMMKKVGKRAEELGLSVEYFPCGFDPHSLDMVIIPALSIAVLDGTSPHVINSSRSNDEVIDMYKLCIDNDIEKSKENELRTIEQRYKLKMTIATNYIKEAKRLHDLLEKYYIESMDFIKVEKKKKELIEEILNK